MCFFSFFWSPFEPSQSKSPKMEKWTNKKNGRFQIDDPIKEIAKIFRGKGVPLEPGVLEIMLKDLHH